MPMPTYSVNRDAVIDNLRMSRALRANDVVEHLFGLLAKQRIKRLAITAGIDEHHEISITFTDGTREDYTLEPFAFGCFRARRLS